MDTPAIATRESSPARVTEAEIRELVFRFYDSVRADPLLGPVFEVRLAGRWDEHLEKMCDFWSTVLLATGRYRGNPREVHNRIPEIGEEHYDRWIDLFGQTARSTLREPLAEDVLGRGHRMRVVLQRASSPSPPSHT